VGKMKKIVLKNLTSLVVFLSLSFGVFLINAVSSDRLLNQNGIYSVRADNKVTVKMERGEFFYEPVYLFGVALDEHTLVLPLAHMDDAEDKKFLFYFMDSGAGLMTLITREVLQSVRLATSQVMVNDSGYHIISCKDGIAYYKSIKDLRNAEEGSVNFIFNGYRELNGISYNTYIDSNAIRRFYNDYLMEINEDGGVYEVFNKLLPSE
jgi:hypothetical protein